MAGAKLNHPKILFLVTEDWYFFSHRLALARAARQAGYRVSVATRVNRHGDLIRREGFQLIPLSLQRSGKNPVREALSFLEILRVYRREKPDLVHHVALKPILYGSWAAWIAGVPAVVNAMAGLGFVFIARGWKAGILRKCVGAALRSAFSLPNCMIILQNEDDKATLRSEGITDSHDVALVKGSGVDTAVFAPSPETADSPLAVLASRLLWDKGVGEFAEAARILRESGLQARFALVGEIDEENPAAVPAGKIEEWRRQGVLEWWGRREDMPEVFRQSHVVCLPSYREGLPKVLIEAASCGRPIVASDVPGCREIVRHGENGLLVPSRDARRLAEALRNLLTEPALRARMGEAGRRIAVSGFSDKKTAAETLSIYRRLLPEDRSP